jgi:NADPH:quinone reductase
MQCLWLRQERLRRLRGSHGEGATLSYESGSAAASTAPTVMHAVYAVDGMAVDLEVPLPIPGPTEILVKVKAAGVNAADLGRLRRSRTGPAVPLGAEVAGIVVALGTAARGFSPGDAVMGMCSAGFAEFAAVDVGTCLPVPAGLGWTAAAGACVSFVTAHDALVTAGRLRPGHSVLVNAVSSGIGLAALQLARRLGAGLTIAISGSQQKLDRLDELGVRFDRGLTSGSEAAAACSAATGGAGVDIAIDSVGAAEWDTTVTAMALGGRIVSVGRLGGDTVSVNLDELARRRLSLVGVTFRTRSRAEASAVFERASHVLLPALEQGVLRVVVDGVYSFANVADAIGGMTAATKLGKIILQD